MNKEVMVKEKNKKNGKEMSYREWYKMKGIEQRGCYNTDDLEGGRKEIYEEEENLLKIIKDKQGKMYIELCNNAPSSKLRIRIFHEQLEDLIAILSIRHNEHFLGSKLFNEAEKLNKKEIKRIIKFLKKDYELLVKFGWRLLDSVGADY